MKKLLTTLACGLLLAMGTAQAADNPQQNKMATCNKDAGEKKGDERKAFMSECLKKKPVSQQDKMKACNKDATGKKGDERKAFMSECLKKDKAA
jgi:psiF repeat-containing protein